MVLELAIIGAVAGAVLGFRYNVLVLVPAVMFAVLFAVIVGVARANSFSSVVLLTVALGGAVQLGYLAGAAVAVAVESICSALRGRSNRELHSLVPAWSHPLREPSWQLTPSTVARVRRPHPPEA